MLAHQATVEKSSSSFFFLNIQKEKAPPKMTAAGTSLLNAVEECFINSLARLSHDRQAASLCSRHSEHNRVHFHVRHTRNRW